MAYTTINKSTSFFDTNLYNSTGSPITISGMDFQPSMVWSKLRTGNNSTSHAVVDQVRGGTNKIFPDMNNAETADASAVTAWTSDGYTFGTSGSFQNSSHPYVHWCWKGNGAGSSNTDGSITSTVSVNTISKMSIVKFTGTGSVATVGHGLGSVPKMILFKNTTRASNWIVYHHSLGNTKNLYLDDTNAEHDRADTFNDTSPTSSVFTVGTADLNISGENIIAFCFGEVDGFSKISGYTGNGNADGAFVYTGFRPEFVIFKQTNTTGNWAMIDGTRSYHNVGNHTLAANSANAESSYGGGESVDGASNKIDLVSNGIKIRDASGYNNTSGGSYIYMAFGQSIVGSNNTPATAR